MSDEEMDQSEPLAKSYMEGRTHERARVVQWLREEFDMNSIPRRIENGEHWDE